MIVNSIYAQTPQRKFVARPTVAQRPMISAQPQNFGGIKKLYEKIDKFFMKVAEKKGVQKIILKIAENKPLQKAVEWASKGDNAEKIAQYLMVAYSALLQTCHVTNIMNNKQMPEERKQTLAINNVLTFFIPTIGAFTVDKAINKGIDRFQKYAENVRGVKFNKHQTTGLKTLKSIFIFSMMYKYFSTVVATPLADVTTKFLKNQGYLKSKDSEKPVQSPSK